MLGESEMSLGTPLAVLVAILFLIPGFLWKFVAKCRTPYAKSHKSELVDCLALSCMNYFIVSIPVYYLLVSYPGDLEIDKPQTFRGHLCYFFLWMLIVFVFPAVCGYATGWMAKSSMLKGGLRRFGIFVLHPAPTAWDYAFARDERYWARIESSDGTLIEGVFDCNSLASGETSERDVFLEDVFRWDTASGEYKRLDSNAGVWVSPKNIKSITFFSIEDSNEGGGADVPSHEG
jgi:hypothetical protein